MALWAASIALLSWVITDWARTGAVAGSSLARPLVSAFSADGQPAPGIGTVTASTPAAMTTNTTNPTTPARTTRSRARRGPELTHELSVPGRSWAISGKSVVVALTRSPACRARARAVVKR